MFSSIVSKLSWRKLLVIACTLTVVLLASTNSQWVDVASAQVSVPTEPGVELLIYRTPSTIITATNNIQWFTRVALTEGDDAGTNFRYVVWLHVPTEWQLQWARTYSYSGDFASDVMTKWYAGSTNFIENSANCNSGGAANFGYKWQVWASGLETLPALGSRHGNEINLRGGLWVPSGSPVGTLNDFRVVVGTFYDDSGDTTLDTYKCDWASFDTKTVVP